MVIPVNARELAIAERAVRMYPSVDNDLGRQGALEGVDLLWFYVVRYYTALCLGCPAFVPEIRS